MSYSYISKFRAQLMGVAMLLIVMFHLSVETTGVLKEIKNIGDIGVNFFFFLSGFSMYYAWKKKPEAAYFLKRRLVRIFLSFLPVVFLWCLPQVLMGRISLLEFAGKCSTLYFWYNGNLLYWFVSGIVLLYLLTPLWMKCYEKNKNVTKIITAILFIVLVILGRTPVLGHICNFTDRSIVYFMGIMVGEAAQQQRKMTTKSYIIILVMVIGGAATLALSKWDLFNYWYKYIVEAFLTFPLILLMSWLFEKLSGVLNFKFLIFCGTITLEAYLFQERILFVLNTVLNKMHIILDKYHICLNILAVLFTFVCAFIYKKIVDKLYKKIA